MTKQEEGVKRVGRLNLGQPVLADGQILPTSLLREGMEGRVIGQPEAVSEIVDAYRLFRVGLSNPRRPAGTFIFLGPTGTGKTRTVEALAETLHGDSGKVLRVDCGEFQLEHEVSRLIGAPPGYLGHRETKPVFTQKSVDENSSLHSPLSIVLFDEIEKAAHSLLRLLLGILDRGILTLGDGSTVKFHKSLIFMTSNLGAKEMYSKIAPEFGFGSAIPSVGGAGDGTGAARRHFPPEFFNRVDKLITFQPLREKELLQVLDLELIALQDRIAEGLGKKDFRIFLTPSARKALIAEGTDLRYGARQLKRTLERRIMYPIADMAEGNLITGAGVQVKHTGSVYTLTPAKDIA